MRERQHLEKSITAIRNIEAELGDQLGMIELGEEEGDASVVGEADTGQWTWNSAIPGSSGRDMRAFLYSAGSMHDLNDLLLQPLAATLTDARAINAAGQILANACSPYLLSGGIPFTQCGAFLLTPVDGTASSP